MKGLFYLIFCFTLIYAGLSAQSSDYVIEKYSVKNGLPPGKIERIYQDHFGFIWIGTSNGLVRYDGYTFYTYKSVNNNNSSLAGNIISCIYESPDSILFVATRGGVHIYNRNTDNFEQIPVNDSIGFTNGFNGRSMCSDNIGNHYITSFDNKGIFRIRVQKDSKKVDVQVFESPSECVNNFGVTRFDSKQRLWFMSMSDIICYQNGKVKRIQFPKTQSYIYINTIAITPDGVLFIATNKGLYYYYEARNEMKLFDLKLDKFKNENLNVTDLTISKNGTFYLTSEYDGLFIADKTGKQIGSFNHDIKNTESIGNNSISAMFVDRMNNIWLGTIQNDLNVLIYKPRYYEKHIYAKNDKNIGLKSNLINCYYEDRDLNLWLGTDGGGLQKYNTVSNTITSIGEGILKSNKIINLVDDSQNHLWICTYGGGLSMYDFGTASINNIHLLYKGNEVENVYDVQMITSEILLVATLRQGLISYNLKTKQSVSMDSVLWKNSYIKINKYLSNILIDNNKNIWLASLGEGLYQFDKNFSLINHFDNNFPDCNLSNNIITSFSINNQNELWVGTNDGLNIVDLKTNKIKVLGENDGLSGSLILNVNCINDFAWVCTNNGISKININNLTIENLGETDGLLTSNSKYGFVRALNNGNLLVAGDYGCMIFNKDSIKNRLLDLNFKITSLKANGEATGNLNNLNVSLPYFKNNISIEFVALVYNYSSQIVYEYSINGQKWNYMGNRHELLFPNMSDGNYEIALKSYIIGKEKQAEIIKLNLTIRPPFWKAGWFLASLIIFISSIVVGLVYQRVRRLKKQSFLLEQKVFERTQMILSQKDELSSQFSKLSKINDELVCSNSEQTKLFDILSHNSNNDSDATIPMSNEEKILQKTIEFIYEHINDETLNVEALSAHANYSKVQFYRIIKTLTELTPVDLIKTIRLQKAKELLSTGKYTVSEVCYNVGFNAPKYFSKCFKEYYNILPSECIPK